MSASRCAASLATSAGAQSASCTSSPAHGWRGAAPIRSDRCSTRTHSTRSAISSSSPAWLEWNITCKDWAWEEIDHRVCEDRCRLDASLGVSGLLRGRATTTRTRPSGFRAAARRGGPHRWAASAWFRARWEGWSLISGVRTTRNIDYTDGRQPRLISVTPVPRRGFTALDSERATGASEHGTGIVSFAGYDDSSR